MTSQRSGVSVPKSDCIHSLLNAIKSGEINEHASVMQEGGRNRIQYIGELSEELGRLARQLDEDLLAYFFEMAALEALDAQKRWDCGTA